MNRRTFLVRAATVGPVVAAAGPLSRIFGSPQTQKAADNFRAIGMRVDPLPPQYAKGINDGLRFTVWSPFRDEGGGISHVFIGWIDKAGRFISERTPPWAPFGFVPEVSK